MDYIAVKKYVACALGLNKGILVTYIIDGVVKNRENECEECFYEDNWWFTKSLSNIQKDLPFWTLEKISKELMRLREEEIVIAKKFYEYNNNPPLSYRIDYNNLSKILTPFEIMYKEQQEEKD